MGCDIHSFAERKNAQGEWVVVEGVHPFDWRNYGMYGFLADVRNYSAVPPIARPRGLPEDVSAPIADAHGWSDLHDTSWLGLDELLMFDYEALFEDQRAPTPPGGRPSVSYRDFLGDEFFADLCSLQEVGAERVVFWFDN